MFQNQIPLFISLLCMGYHVTAQLIQLEDTSCQEPGCDIINLKETKMTLTQLVSRVEALENASLKHEQDKQDLKEEIEDLKEENEQINLQLTSLHSLGDYYGDQPSTEDQEKPTMVAFHGVSRKRTSLDNTGKVITYTGAPVNIGGALNASSGAVTIPVKGVYWVSFWALATSKTTNRVDIQVNGEGQMYGHSGNAKEGNTQYMLGNAGLLQLEEGDKVTVKCAWGVVDHLQPYTQFSGYLVYPL